MIRARLQPPSQRAFDPWSLLAAAFLIACTLVIAFPEFVNAADLPKHSTVRASETDSGKVKVKWNLKRKSTNERALIEIARSSNGAPYKLIAQIDKSMKKGSWTDKTATSGYHFYRIRSVKSNARSGWVTSNSVFVDENSNPSPSPTPPSESPPTSGSCSAAQLPAGVSECEAGYEAQVLTIVNSERAKVGLSALTSESHLRCSARIHTVYMVTQQNMTHDLWLEHIGQGGYSWSTVGQNIAYGYTTSPAVMTGWMNSEGHRANILRTSFRDIGVSCLRDSTGRHWWTQDFGAPR